MNIVVLNDSCEIDGGAARIAIEDAQLLASRGHRVFFISACGTPPTVVGDSIEWISLGQRNILEEPRRWLAMLRGLWNLRAASVLKRILRDLPQDSTVVHLHSWSKALSGSVVATAHMRDYRIICTLHDYFVICPNGGLYDYPTRSICHLRPMSGSCMARNCDSRSRVHKVWRVLRQLSWRYLAGIPFHFHQMIAVSGFAAEKMAAYIPNRAAIQVIENLPDMPRPELVPTDQRGSIVYMGRVAAEKGVDIYLEACRIANVPAEIWGDGPLLAELKAAWPQASFKGWIEPAKLQAILGRALALVVPSLWYETYGMVVAEAAAAGVTVIVSDHGAAADLVKDEVTGLHFRAGDASDLALKIARLHRDPELACSMGRAAYRQFWQDHAIRREQRIAQIEHAYHVLLETAA